MSRFSEKQVAYALRRAEAGTAVGDVCRQLGISDATFFVWKKRYGHLGVQERCAAPVSSRTRMPGSSARSRTSLDKHILTGALRREG